MGVDSQVSGVVPNLVGLVLTSGGVFEDEVEALMLKDSTNLLTRKSGHEPIVPVHLKVTFLGNDAGGWDRSSTSLGEDPHDLSVERLLEHHAYEVGLKVECLSGLFVCVLKGSVGSGRVFGHVDSCGMGGEPFPILSIIILYHETAYTCTNVSILFVYFRLLLSHAA